MEQVQQFERTRVETGGHGVTITSWYEPDKARWRANAPALLHLLADANPEQLTGSTREKAIQSITTIVGQRLEKASRIPALSQTRSV